MHRSTVDSSRMMGYVSILYAVYFRVIYNWIDYYGAQVMAVSNSLWNLEVWCM
jgi:hypothetical protein